MYIYNIIIYILISSYIRFSHILGWLLHVITHHLSPPKRKTQKRGIRAKATHFGSEMERELWPGIIQWNRWDNPMGLIMD